MTQVERTSEPTGAAAPTVRALVLHTTTAMIAASMLTIFLHESAHAVAGMTLGVASRMYPFAAMPVTEVSRETDTIIMLAGPAFSLVLGLVLSFLIRPSRKPGSAYLFGVWLAYTSLLEGAGYLIFTPFGIGDTGMAAAEWGLSMSVGWFGFVGGLGIALLLAIRYARRIVPLVPAGDLPRLRGLSFFPWMIGVVVAIVLSFVWMLLSDISLDPGSMIAVAMGSVALGIWAPMAMPFTARPSNPVPDSTPLRLSRIPVLSGVVLVAMVIANVLLLSGPTWG